MKTRILTFFSLVIIAGTLTIWSCKKDDEEKVATKQDASALAKKDAVSNTAFNDVYSESEAVISDLEGDNYPAADTRKNSSINGSVVITVTKNSGNNTAFPKEITVIYTNYVSGNGIKKNGTVKITQSAKMRESGAIRVVTLDNFVVNDSIKLEGKVTISNLGLVNDKPSIKAQLSNGKVTFNRSGFYMTREFTRTITWESGFDPSSIFYIFDDVYSFNETVNGSTSNGFNYNSTTPVPLEYRIGDLCIKKGKINLTVGGMKAYFDFTRATCSEKIKLTIEGDSETI
jgi:hypothetical protein